MNEPLKYLDIAEFREIGYLHEVNRRFFHPLGLALEIVGDDEDGTEHLGGIWDYREDPVGITFEELDDVKMANVASLEKKRIPERTVALGYWIQGMPSAEPDLLQRESNDV